jgi:hypothetical protein
MDKKLRDTGIELIGEAFWGTHIGQFQGQCIYY